MFESLIPENVQNKFIALIPSSAPIDWRMIGSNRLLEVYYAIEGLDKYYGSWIFGAGAGYTYEINYGTFSEELRNVHVSPISIFVKFGAIFLILFYSYLLYIVHKLRNKHKLMKNHIYTSLLIYMIIYLMFYQFTAYVFVGDLSFWLVFGLMNAKLYNFLSNKRLQV
jgi:hypothetical protein